jgi:hypothetical protein
MSSVSWPDKARYLARRAREAGEIAVFWTGEPADNPGLVGSTTDWDGDESYAHCLVGFFGGDATAEEILTEIGHFLGDGALEGVASAASVPAEQAPEQAPADQEGSDEVDAAAAEGPEPETAPDPQPQEIGEPREPELAAWTAQSRPLPGPAALNLAAGRLKPAPRYEPEPEPEDPPAAPAVTTPDQPQEPTVSEDSTPGQEVLTISGGPPAPPSINHDAERDARAGLYRGWLEAYEARDSERLAAYEYLIGCLDAARPQTSRT